jgi:hypothetical protein
MRCQSEVLHSSLTHALAIETPKVMMVVFDNFFNAMKVKPPATEQLDLLALLLLSPHQPDAHLLHFLNFPQTQIILYFSTIFSPTPFLTLPSPLPYQQT